jgi:hypothetical protein
MRVLGLEPSLLAAAEYAGADNRSASAPARELAHPGSQRCSLILARTVVLDTAMLSDNTAGPPPSDGIVTYNVAHCLALQRGPGHFFELMYARSLCRDLNPPPTFSNAGSHLAAA